MGRCRALGARVSALWAALAMVVQDLLAVFLVQAEARNRAVLAGLLDTVAWPFGITQVTISVSALQSRHAGRVAVVIAAVSIANFAGSAAAVKIGKRFIKDKAAVCPCPNCGGAA